MTQQAAPPMTGQVLLNAVERITASPDEICSLVDRFRSPGPAGLHRTAERIVAHYSRRAALVGGVTALPATLPGVGTLAALVAGPLADVVMLLKYEVEMCMALSRAHGHDIHRADERQRILLLAALKTAELGPDPCVLRDLKDLTGISGAALWRYAPRRVSKLLVTVLAALAAASLSRGLLRAVPLLGVAVGASMNKLLTARVGRIAHEELLLRAKLERDAIAAEAAPGC